MRSLTFDRFAIMSVTQTSCGNSRSGNTPLTVQRKVESASRGFSDVMMKRDLHGSPRHPQYTPNFSQFQVPVSAMYPIRNAC